MNYASHFLPKKELGETFNAYAMDAEGLMP